MKKHLKGYSFIFLDTDDKVKDWLEKDNEPWGFSKAFELLRSNFNSNTSENQLKNNILKGSEYRKIFMTHQPTNELYGIAIYREHKKFGENFMELLYFCVKRKNRGLGMRFLTKILDWASVKKLYSEIVLMADFNAVKFFFKNEFVMIDFNEFNKDRKEKLQQFDFATLMHKRLDNFDENRLDKLKLVPHD
jgi:hypothetical protein